MTIPFIGQAYQDRSIPVSSQRCVNWYPEVEPGEARNPITLKSAAGVAAYQSFGSLSVRGMRYVEILDLLFVVMGPSLYSVDRSGTVTELGAISGNGLVAMDDSGTQLAIAAGNAYIYDQDQGLTLQTELGQVIDVTFQDGYFLFVNEIQPGLANQFKLTGFFNGRVFDPVDVQGAITTSDKAVGIEQCNGRIWLFSQNSYGVWANTGSSDFPFGPISSASFNNFGLAGTHAKVVADSDIYWCGSDGRIYKTEGYGPRRVSHYGIENSIRTYSKIDDCEAFQWIENGHRFIAFVFPTGGQAWVYDSTSGLWHERSSGVNGGLWNVRFVEKAFDKTIVGDRSTPRLGMFDLDIFTEYGEMMRARRTTPVLNANQAPVFLPRLELVFEVGRSSGVPDPKARLAWSNNFGVTYKNPVWRSLGNVGEYNQRATWRMIGEARNRTFDLQITDSVPRTLIAVRGEPEAGQI